MAVFQNVLKMMNVLFVTMETKIRSVLRTEQLNCCINYKLILFNTDPGVSYVRQDKHTLDQTVLINHVTCSTG